MKTYSVTYNTTTSYEAVVKAKNKEEAKKKVTEVIGDPVEIEHIYEVNRNA
jgi:hypothetical protein